MTTEVSTQVVKIDFKKILDNALNKEYWGRKWKIFDYDGYYSIIELEDILVRNHIVGLRVTMRNDDLELYDYEWIRLPMEQYNEVVFRKKLLSEMHTMIRSFERTLAMRKNQYETLVDEQNKAIEDYKLKVSKHLDELEITDEDVRKVYIKRKVKDKNFNKEISEFIRSHMDHELRHVHHMIDAMVQFVDREE